jgi:hypothetical protein
LKSFSIVGLDELFDCFFSKNNSIEDCQTQFDFIEHTLVDCDGKCWKSVDLLDMKRLGNDSRERLKLKEKALSSLRSSRRCFSADELLRAAEMGINTANGCRKLNRENEKPKEICFCSDQDMCNKVNKMTKNFLIYCSNILFLWIFILLY